MVKYKEIEYKSSLNKLKYPDSWFWARYTINPYSGCEHACIYCDARSQRYYLNDFENEVVIKKDIDKKLETRIKRARKLIIDVVAAGGVNDAYQPIEKIVENTRKILQVLAKYNYPVNIATKSNLITKDIDLFKKIAKSAWCTIGFSITTTNEDLAKFLEPYASPPSGRLEALKTIKKQIPDVQVGTYFMPIIPFLEDSEENIKDVIKNSKEAGADFLLFSPGLTLRDLQADFFYKKLNESKYSYMLKNLLDLYKGKVYPPAEYVKKIHLILLENCDKYNLNFRIKRWIPSDYRKWNYKISELLLNKQYLDALKTGKSNRSMIWAGLNLNNLEESILDIYKRGELLKLQNFNKKIVEFIKPYIEESDDLKRKTGLERFL